MIKSRFGLKVMGLCVVVAGLMAVVAASAQAEAGANWMVATKNVTGTEKFPVKVKELESETASLLTTLVGSAVKILCKKAELTGASLEKEGSVTKGGTVTFSGCETFLNGTLSIPCEPETAGVKGVIKTKAGKGLLVLVGTPTVTDTLIAPETGTILAEINSTEKCAVGQKITIEGELFLKDCEKEGITAEKKVHLTEADNVNGTLTANKKAATIDGSALIELVGGASAWSGLPA